MSSKKLALLTAFLLALSGCSTLAPTPPEDVHEDLGSTVNWRVVGKVPHDPSSFTQGLEMLEPGVLVESSGKKGESRITVYEAETGEVLRQERLEDSVFGEGLTVVNDEILQLTWKAGVGYRWDAESLEGVDMFEYEGEGWGVCHDEKTDTVWLSDGTSTLRSFDPETFDQVGSLSVVSETGEPVERLNELECVDGNVWANVWYSDSIVNIDLESGQVVDRVNFGELVQQAEEESGEPFAREEVLNGIAYDEYSDTWYVTGKFWEWTYLVEFDGARVL